MHLLQYKAKFFIHLCFWGRNLLRIKTLKHPSWEASINIKENYFWFVYTRLHSSILVYICLDLSINSTTLAYIRLDSSSGSFTLVHICLHSPKFVYTRLHSSSESFVFLEEIVVL